MKFINLTSHDINEVTTGITIPASGRVARVKSSTIKVAEHNKYLSIHQLLVLLRAYKNLKLMLYTSYLH